MLDPKLFWMSTNRVQVRRPILVCDNSPSLASLTHRCNKRLVGDVNVEVALEATFRDVQPVLWEEAPSKKLATKDAIQVRRPPNMLPRTVVKW